MPMTARRLAETVTNVPSLPAVFARLNAAIDDPRSSIRDIEAVVCEDTSLAGRLLRLANSAYFGFPARVDTLSRAITMVGSRQIRDLAMATSVVDTFRGVSPSLITMESFWRHSIGCGLVARILSSWRRDSNPEQYFVSGLLHDIGRLVLFLKLGHEMSDVIDETSTSGQLLFQCEQERFGFDHAVVGGELLKRWNLPSHICAAVQYHHAPLQAGSHQHAAAMVHVADVLINGIACGSSGERHIPPLDPDAWQLLDLSPTVIGPTLDLLERQLEDTLSMLLGNE